MNHTETISDTHFSARRCGEEVRRLINSSPRTMLQYALIVPAVIMAVAFMTDYFCLDENLNRWDFEPDAKYCRIYYDRTLSIMAALEINVFFVLGAASMSMCFGGLREARTRVVTLMTPVRASEQLAAQTIIHGVGFLAVFIVSYVVVDLVRPVLFTVYNFNHTTYFTSTISLLFVPVGTLVRFFAVLMSGWLFVSSCFLAGSVFAPRGTFVRTAVFLLVLFLLLLAWSVVIAQAFDSPIDSLMAFLDSLSPYIFSLFLLSLSVVNYIMALRRLKEYTVR